MSVPRQRWCEYNCIKINHMCANIGCFFIWSIVLVQVVLLRSTISSSVSNSVANRVFSRRYGCSNNITLYIDVLMFSLISIYVYVLVVDQLIQRKNASNISFMKHNLELKYQSHSFQFQSDGSSSLRSC